jgi:hypothetical protein
VMNTLSELAIVALAGVVTLWALGQRSSAVPGEPQSTRPRRRRHSPLATSL